MVKNECAQCIYGTTCVTFRRGTVLIGLLHTVSADQIIIVAQQLMFKDMVFDIVIRVRELVCLTVYLVDGLSDAGCDYAMERIHTREICLRCRRSRYSAVHHNELQDDIDRRKFSDRYVLGKQMTTDSAGKPTSCTGLGLYIS